MPQYACRKATYPDVCAIMKIMAQAKAHMRREGRNQWNDAYPALSHITADIERNYGTVLTDGNEIVAYAAVVYDGEPAYNRLDGRWLSEQSYVAVHRLAVNDDYKHRGVATSFIRMIADRAATRVHSFKIDTNHDNAHMLRILDRLGFTYCGKISYEGSERLAYERII